MKLVLKIAKIIPVFVLILFFLGCSDDEEDNLPKVNAIFTHTISENTGTVTFINASNNATNFLWDFGDNETSTEINPTKTYESGTYVITLMASNVAGGSDITSDTITIKIKDLITLPVTFDDTNTNYNAITFSGAEYEIVDNPDASGSNSTVSKVGEIRNSGALYEGIFFTLGTQIDLTDEMTIGINFWSDKSVDVLMKLEEGNTSVEDIKNHKGTGWETLYFDFVSDVQFSRLTLFVDGAGTKDGTFYIDDIFQTITICRESDLQLPIDFDCEGNPYRLETFGGTEFEIITNPKIEGKNNIESKVGQIINSGKAFEGGTFSLDIPIDLSLGDAVSLKLYSSVAIPVLLKLEGSNSIETLKDHKGSGWEKLTFNFNSEEEFDQLTLLLDPTGTTAGTFYIDDILQSESDKVAPVITLIGESVLNLIVGADFTDPGATATDNVDGDITDGIIVSGDVVDPNIEGSYSITYNISDDAGNSALEVTRIVIVEASDTTPPVITLIGASTIDVILGNPFTDPGATANDNVDGNISANIIITGSVDVNTVGNYILTYNVSDAIGNPANEITRTVVVSENAGGGGDGGLLTNGSFETGDDTGWLLFSNGGTTSIDNTINNGGTFSGMLATNGASNPGFKQERFGIGTVQAGDVVQVSFDHIGSATDPEGGVFNVLLFVERAEGEVGDPITHIFDPRPTLTSGWTSFTATYTIPSGASVTGGLSILIETVCGGTPGCSVSANIDNVSVVLNP